MTTRLKPALIVLVAACHEAPVESCPSPRVAGISAERAAPVARPSPFDSVFQAGGTEFGVSPALRKANGWVGTRWQMVEGREEFAGRPPVFGVMALGGTALERGAALAGVSVEAGRRDAAANIRAAAALLRGYAAEAGGDWDAAAARFSGIDLPAGRAAYTRAITQAHGRAGPAAAAAGCPPNPGGAPDYAPAVWRASPNFDQRPADQTGTLHMVIIHTCERDYASCWSWLVNPASQASAHYVVDEEGGEISQLVPANRTDPGPNWPWIPYLHRVQALCGEVVVDDSAQFNDPAVAMVSVPAAWTAADTTPDYYGGGYRWGPTQPAAGDGAVFSFLVAAAGSRTLDARWTSGTNRSPQAQYAVITPTGDTLRIVPVDQRTGGGTWHTLGTWTFPAGWNQVVLLRHAASGSVVVADAVRVRQ